MTYGNLNLTFQQVNKLEYLVSSGVDRLMEAVESILASISQGQQDQYIEPANDALMQAILSRLVALEFFKQYDVTEDILLYRVVIHDTVRDRDLYVSLGKLQDPTKDSSELKIVESYFIK